MSDDWWIKSFVGSLVILILGITSSKGNIEDCSLCCILQRSTEDLNCTWTNNSSLQLSVVLRSTSNQNDVPQNFTIAPGQNWLLIRRENLILHHEYQLSISGGTWTETLILTYCDGCENVFIAAPILNSSVYEEEDDDRLAVDVIWNHVKDHSHPPEVELRYRILGASDWILVPSSDLEPNSYQLTDPEPYTDYEFQIRYATNENQKSRGLWSESYVLTTPEEVPVGTLDIWRHVDQENSVLVKWKPLSRRFARGKILDYHVTYIHNNKSRTTEKPCCSSALPAQSTDVCVSARNSVGLGPNSCVIPLCSVAADMGDFVGKAWGDPSGRIAVKWEDSMKYGFPVNYVVEWSKGKSSGMDWIRNLAANQTLMLPGKFSPGVLYLISIYALYNDSCVQIFSTEAYGQEEAPLAAPTYSIHVLSSSEVFISWDEIPRHNLRGNLKHYNIYVNSTAGSQRHTVHGRNMTLSTLLPKTVYHVFITASTAAGEGVPSGGQTFQTMGVRDLHPLTLPLVSLIGVCILAVAIIIHPQVRKTLLLALWPKIPKPENTFNGTTISTKIWESQQTPSNPPITEVEEMEPVSPPSPVPDRRQAITSGYEKHFMPTPEEVMGLC